MPRGYKKGTTEEKAGLLAGQKQQKKQEKKEAKVVKKAEKKEAKAASKLPNRGESILQRANTTKHMTPAEHSAQLKEARRKVSEKAGSTRRTNVPTKVMSVKSFQRTGGRKFTTEHATQKDFSGAAGSVFVTKSSATPPVFTAYHQYESK